MRASKDKEMPDDTQYRDFASKAMVYIARNLRQRQTPAEVILWEALRNRRLAGLKFRRQHPIANTAYVVDFLCYDARLVIELDGEVHTKHKTEDTLRQANIEAQGFRVLRFKNEAVYLDVMGVLEQIIKTALER